MQKAESKSSGILFGAAIGAVIRFFIPLTSQTALLAVPGLRQIFANSPFSVTITSTGIGMVVGGIIGALALQNASPFPKTAQKEVNDIQFQLREEELDIEKDWVKTADVDIHKAVLTDEETVTVPVTREELVIETTEAGSDDQETLRIPLSEERIEVIKHPVQLNDVSVYSERFTENETVNETIKKEKLVIDREGDAKVTVIDSNKNP